jgi:hypothetical protein
MAQIVIFAPLGEDVSAGQTALEEAGHEVEVVEATAVNLLHMAAGMLEDSGDEEPAEEPAPEEDPLAEPAEDAPVEDIPPTEEPKQESLGLVSIDGEFIPAYLDRNTNVPMLHVASLTGQGEKVSYKINESLFSFWREGPLAKTVEIGEDGTVQMVAIGAAAKKPFIILDRVNAARLGLV